MMKTIGIGMLIVCGVLAAPALANAAGYDAPELVGSAAAAPIFCGGGYEKTGDTEKCSGISVWDPRT